MRQASETSSPRPSATRVSKPVSKAARPQRTRAAFPLLRAGGQGRGRTADLPLFRRTLIPTELPDRAGVPPVCAVLTGFEPATSTLTGWRALRAALQDHLYRPRPASSAPNGIRTRAAALKGRCPRPLDDGGLRRSSPPRTRGARRRGPPQHRGRRPPPAKRVARTDLWGRRRAPYT